jgi:6-pyruvoyltetrahydropterin/6-carboxytetrahydropterin synthase
MYEVTVTGSFSSAHRLREYAGNCEKLHGHNWKVEVTLAGRTVDRLGMLVDFRQARRALRAILDELDHRYLNDLAPFARMNPTTENLARWITGRMTSSFPPAGGVSIARVTVWESEGCSATYAPGAARPGRTRAAAGRPRARQGQKGERK